MPDIDSVWTDKETYPYCFVLCEKIDGSIISVLYLASGKVVVGANSGLPSFAIYSGANSAFSYDPDGVVGDAVDGWVYMGSEDTIGFDTNSNLLCWTNYDILDANGSLYFSKSSDPIPLDGYNVIEWNGDTTGLTSFDTVFYKVSNNIPVYTQFVGGYLVADALNGIRDVYSVTYDDIIVVPNDGYYLVLEPVLVAQDTTILPATGIYALSSGDGYVPLIAYRTTETPPDEGGGDDDEPQPPAGG